MDARTRPTRVLVVDDDDDGIRELIVRYLKAYGYGAASAPEQPDGLSAVERERPDVVLCDVDSPLPDRLVALGAAGSPVGRIRVARYSARWRGEDRPDRRFLPLPFGRSELERAVTSAQPAA